MHSGVLQEMTIDEVRELAPRVAVLGVASTEPHGSHLPYGTDVYQCDSLCRRAVERANARGARVIQYPTLPIGNNVNFKAFPLACRVRVRTLMNVILDIIEALEEDGLRKIVLVNGHGGNTDTLRAVLREQVDRSPAREPGAFVCMVEASAFVSSEAAAALEHPSPHAGESETSRMLYLRPDLVRSAKLGEQVMHRAMIPALETGQVAWVRPWHLFMPLSGGGDTRKSTAAKGEALIESSAAGLADFLVELESAPWGPHFPYAPATEG